MPLSHRPAFKFLGTSQWVLLALAAASAMALVPACSPVAPGGDGDGGVGGEGDGDIGGGLNPGDGDIGGIPGDGDGDGDGPGGIPAGNFCDTFELVFEPKTPTVYIAVDRSSSMFAPGEAPNFWETLKAGLLPIVQSLQGDVRFGFSSYTGTANNDASCGLDATKVPIAANNYDAIASAWNALGEPPVKGETPTSFAIQQATDVLLADESPGGRFILLVSDGAPDMCNDTYNACGVDGTIASLQVAASQGVRTLVFGIETEGVTQELFDKFAQAGAGEAPVAPMIEGQDAGVYDQYSGTMANNCTDKGIWPDLRTSNAAFRREVGMVESTFEPASAYSSTPGQATAFLSTDLDALAAQIQSSLAGLKSCQIAVNFDVVDAAAGQIYVDDKTTPVPNDEWKLVEGSTSVIQLEGQACDTWQTEGVDYFFAGFPCEAIIVK